MKHMGGECVLEYPIEELFALVGELAERYTGKASTSVTYETVQQLMDAVLYCIRENEAEAPYQKADEAKPARQGSYSTAKEAYQAGFGLVTAKVRKANEIYTELIMDFNDYGNIAYHDTVVKGIPEFFKWYDPELNPQNHIILMDYTVLEDLRKLQGVDLLFEYINRIRLEQKFLKKFPEEYVRGVLIQYEPEYEQSFINPCGVLLSKLLASMLAGIKAEKIKPDPEDYEKLSSIVNAAERERLNADVTRLLGVLVKNLFQEDRELYRYLEHVIPDFTAELINGAKNDTLYHVI